MTHIQEPVTVGQFITALRAEHAIDSLTEALRSGRRQAEHYRNTGTGWTCDLETANYYEGRVSAIIFALNLLDGYKANR